ncbi:hypothetical protein DOTSEDRAFT_70406 [Dothistroma septosporum NZE10]|uniref:DUF1168-domain-containing protein n=1 Tax=Dothistroma septosporum (strain NZE10 / CBS 128990) TaxID=675120 RepID=N1PSG5_DOTSN|nr:hypothetical protein DOTSEDRAFT_70406 [Dothistroma septosporum NZE10]
MSENIPESIPTSISSKSHRPTKKRALTPSTQQSAEVEALFANPDRADTALALEPKGKSVAAPPEIVANVQGSSAGAGSGEFHVYKASRRREYERLRAMDEEVKGEEAEKKFQKHKEERERKYDEKLSKNRAKREKVKLRAQKKKAGGDAMEGVESGRKENGDGVKKKLAPTKIALPSSGAAAEDAQADGAESAVREEGGITIHDDDDDD